MKMKRVLLLAIAALFLGVFVLSSNSSGMEKWVSFRTGILKIPFEKYRYGDLYGLSNLSDYKHTGFSEQDVRPHYVRHSKATNVHLYGIVDSYLWTFMPHDSLLHNVDAYRFTRWDYEAKQFHLDPSKKNILLLEMVERRVRYTLPDTPGVYRHLALVDAADKETVRPVEPSSWIANHVFNKNIEQNLEFNLFDYALFRPFKELKANLNHRVFNRTNADVVLSNTRHQLYFAPTVDSTKNTGAFNPLPAEEVDALVTDLNAIYKHYRKAGFTEVYLAVIPNPVTILEPELGSYNGLLPRLQQYVGLRMPVIDVYSNFKHHKDQPLYQISDSHWGKEGFLMGVKQIDSVLADHVNK